MCTHVRTPGIVYYLFFNMTLEYVYILHVYVHIRTPGTILHILIAPNLLAQTKSCLSTSRWNNPRKSRREL